MRKLWRVVTGIALVCLVVGILAVGLGFFMGSSPVAIGEHGNLNEYIARLEANRAVLLQMWDDFLYYFGIGQ